MTTVPSQQRFKYPSSLWVESAPESFPGLETVVVNEPLAKELGLDPALLRQPKGAFDLVRGHWTEPSVALAYAGHQFGHFTMLGDGRAHLVGQLRSFSGREFDVQLKGSGRTPFSRRGDGRAALKPMLRELLVSEAMHGLGIPTTRILAVLSTGESVQRDQLEPGAIAVRIAQSHLRVGTFEYLAATRNRVGARDALETYLAQCRPAGVSAHDLSTSELAVAVFKEVLIRQVELLAQWMSVGFVHGVMNTDNMALSGETIDYGPCAFINSYDPDAVFSSIDQTGRYRFGQQPQIAKWNLTRFADALLNLEMNPETGTLDEALIAIYRNELESFDQKFESAWMNRLAAKFGFATESEAERKWLKSMLSLLQDEKLDWTDFFQAGLENWLADSTSESDADRTTRLLGPVSGQVHQGMAQWKNRLARLGPFDAITDRLIAHNPVFVPRNQRVEDLLQSVQRDDTKSDSSRSPWITAEFLRALDDVRAPYRIQLAIGKGALMTQVPQLEAKERWQISRVERDCSFQTFCGT